MQQTLDHAQATGPNPTSQRALEYRLAEAINALSSPPSPAPAESGAVGTSLIEEARQEIVLAIAFLGRDVGTSRITSTAEGLIARLVPLSKKLAHPSPAPSASMGRVTDELIGKCLEAMAQSTVTYPDGEVSAPLIDWFKIDAQDALDFGVLKEPKFDSYSDIAVMQQEWYVEELLRQPFKNALKVLVAALDSPPDHGGGEGERPAKWHDIGYLMSIIDAAIEDGFDPDEDGPILDEIREEVSAGLHTIPTRASLPTQESEDGR